MNAISFLKCCADVNRLHLLLLIKHCSELCVCDLVAALQIEQPRVSRYLSQLRKCGLVDDQRRGKWVFYRLHPSLPNWAHNILTAAAEAQVQQLVQPLSRLAKPNC